MIVSDLDLLRVLAATPIQSHQLQRRPNDEMDRTPVLNVKEVDSLTKNLGLVIPSRFLSAVLRAAGPAVAPAYSRLRRSLPSRRPRYARDAV